MNATQSRTRPMSEAEAGASRPVKVRPTGDKLLVRRLKAADKTPGGIILPDQAQQKPGKGQIVAVGPGLTLIDPPADSDIIGKMPSMSVGQTVYFTPYAGNKIELEGDADEYLLMREEEVLATVVEDLPC